MSLGDNIIVSVPCHNCQTWKDCVSGRAKCIEVETDITKKVTDGQVVRAGISVTWNVAYCHDLKVMSSNPGRVVLGVLGTSVLSRI